MEGTDEQKEQALLALFVAWCIAESKLSLETLQGRTGLHRARLGRMRLGRDSPSIDDAGLVLRAVGKQVLERVTDKHFGARSIADAEQLCGAGRSLPDHETLLGRLNGLWSTTIPFAPLEQKHDPAVVFRNGCCDSDASTDASRTCGCRSCCP